MAARGARRPTQQTHAPPPLARADISCDEREHTLASLPTSTAPTNVLATYVICMVRYIGSLSTSMCSTDKLACEQYKHYDAMRQI